MKEDKYTIKKTNVECYKLRFKAGFAWADITIDAADRTGRIQIASDYGSWEYYWGACGIEFKEFLVGLNISYAAGKFGEDKWFDQIKTIEALKIRIKEYTIEKEELYELNLELSNLEDSSCKEEFTAKMWLSDKIMEMEDHCPDMINDISPSFKDFWNKIWLLFIDELKKELA